MDFPHRQQGHKSSHFNNMFDECGAGYLHSSAAEKDERMEAVQLNEIDVISMFDLLIINY